MKSRFMSASIALIVIGSAQGAAAQQASCVAPDDLSDAVTYSMPMLYEAVQAPCSSEVAQSAFMTNEASAFVDQFRAQSDAAWPGTIRLLKVFMTARGDGDDVMGEAIAQMPDEAVRPLVDVIIGQMVNERITKNIKPSTCSDIAEAMELVAPLPPENISGLASFLARQADLDNPPVCGTKKASAE